MLELLHPRLLSHLGIRVDRPEGVPLLSVLPCEHSDLQHGQIEERPRVHLIVQRSQDSFLGLH
jgi:hypothetical protein